MKVLNIDNFAQVKRQLVANGQTHDVLELSIQQFINNLKAAEELEGAGKLPTTPETLSKQVENSVQAILQSVPSLPAEYLRTRPVEALGAILKFIRGEMDPDNLTPSDATDGGEGDEKKT